MNEFCVNRTTTVVTLVQGLTQITDMSVVKVYLALVSCSLIRWAWPSKHRIEAVLRGKGGGNFT